MDTLRCVQHLDTKRSSFFGTSRPDGEEYCYPREFVEKFDIPFVTSQPNAAITFAGDNNNTGPLIVVLSRPKIAGTSPDGSTDMIEYAMTQSESQGEVVSMKQFLEISGGPCSLFNDSISERAAAFVG